MSANTFVWRWSITCTMHFCFALCVVKSLVSADTSGMQVITPTSTSAVLDATCAMLTCIGCMLPDLCNARTAARMPQTACSLPA